MLDTIEYRRFYTSESRDVSPRLDDVTTCDDVTALRFCFQVLSPNRSSIPLVLTEGIGVDDGAGGVGSPHVIEFRSYLPPGVHCFPADAIANRRALIGDIVGLVFNTTAPCVVQIQMTTSNYIYDILPYIRFGRDNDLLSLGRPKSVGRQRRSQDSIFKRRMKSDA